MEANKTIRSFFLPFFILKLYSVVMLKQCSILEEAPFATRVFVIASNDNDFMAHLWFFSIHAWLWFDNTDQYHIDLLCSLS